MYKIAIVEDDLPTRGLLKEYAARFCREKGEDCMAILFPNGMEFISNYTSDFDVVLMDIEMPLLNGMETARKLRKIDESVILIFITNMAQYAINGYEVDASDFLLKPVGYFTFALKLAKALRLRGRRRGESLCLETSDGKVRLRTSDIYYIESDKHYCVFHTENGEYRSRVTMRDTQEALSDKGFARCNAAYLVNLAYVKKVRQYTVWVGKYELAVSRTRKKEFIDELTVYLGGGRLV